MKLRPVLRSLSQAGSSGAAVWTPSAFGSRLLAWYDPSDLSVQWQDSARTTAAVFGSPVGGVQNKATFRGVNYMQQSVAGSRPVLSADSGGYAYWDCDGLDDGFLSSAALDFSAFSQLTVCVCARKTSDAAVGVILELTASAVSTNGGFYLSGPDVAAAANYGFMTRGTVANASRRATTYTAPVSNVVYFEMDNSAGTIATQIVPRINGAAPTMTDVGGPTTAGAFANASLYLGRRNNASVPYTGRVYQVVIVSGSVSTLSTTERASLETFMGSKIGISL